MGEGGASTWLEEEEDDMMAEEEGSGDNKEGEKHERDDSEEEEATVTVTGMEIGGFSRFGSLSHLVHAEDLLTCTGPGSQCHHQQLAVILRTP